eukprot:TRINITY_DN117_c1_g2_i4.p1 TRINITY_DN117_c1_g2~~TRINITY_DN117_c1_g2_i4.p1  ORF type:complete len:319 (-),score=177.58 TRINITY_DN117_c1_g2_i4:928-1884(-)
MADKALIAKNNGNTAFLNGKFEESITYFTEAISYDPNNHVLYSNRSGAYASLKDWTKALSDAQKTVELKSDFAKGFSRLGIAYFYLGDLEKATKAYQDGLKLDPNNQQLKQGLEQAQIETRQRGLKGLQKLFGNDIFARAATNPKIASYLNDKSFVDAIKEIQADPQNLAKHIGDPRITEVISAYLGDLKNQAPSSSEGESIPEYRPTPQPQSQSQPQPQPQSQPQSKPQSTSTTTKKEEQQHSEEEVREIENKKRANVLKEEGTEFYKKKQFEAALEKYTQAAEIDPDNFSIPLNITGLIFYLIFLNHFLQFLLIFK